VQVWALVNDRAGRLWTGTNSRYTRRRMGWTTTSCAIQDSRRPHVAQALGLPADAGQP